MATAPLKLTIENIRSFRGETHVPLRPVTVLVGENSSGKTTVLAALNLAMQLGRPERVDFNAPPFELGSYDELAHFHRGQGARAQEFTLGIELAVARGSRMRRTGAATEVPLAKDVDCVTLFATFERDREQPRLRRWAATTRRASIELSRREGGGWDCSLAAGGARWDLGRDALKAAHGAPGVGDLLWHFRRDALRGERRPDEVREADAGPASTALIPDFLWTLERDLLPVVSARPPRPSAPLRATPQRVYSPSTRPADAEGSHVPAQLARMARYEDARWVEFGKRIAPFGEDSGLFHTIRIGNLGRKASDPFQIKVRVDKHEFNLMDVGYGVSQALPLLADVVLSDRGTLHLLQQPEVHMHPRAQAAMANLLCSLARDEQKRFLVETHSDALLDRLRLLVREGEVPADDVALLFIDRGADGSVVHAMTIDANGNLLGAPPSYAAFFLDEQRRLLAPQNVRHR